MGELYDRAAALNKPIADRWKMRTREDLIRRLTASDIDYIAGPVFNPAHKITEAEGKALIAIFEASLFADGTYGLRLSGKGLGFVSELLGPQKGSWRVEKGALLLVDKEAGSGTERSLSWPINELHSDRAVLAGERWRRVAEAERSR